MRINSQITAFRPLSQYDVPSHNESRSNVGLFFISCDHVIYQKLTMNYEHIHFNKPGAVVWIRLIFYLTH